MKPTSTLPKPFPVVIALVVSALITRTPAHAIGSTRAKALFKHPPREYSTGPLWVWNDLLTEQQIRDTMHDLASQGVKQVWVHPRPGLMTPYLSTDWFRLWKVSLEEAARLDMNVWIYDENSYPSGFAGGLVPEAMPESRGRGLAFRESGTPPKWSDDVIGVYRLENGTWEDVSADSRSGATQPEGRYLAAAQIRAGNSPWHGNRCYVNLLSPGVTEKFLELTLEPYRQEIGREFGRRVPGVFTDEPNIRPAGGLPWSEVLAAEFQKRWGYDLIAQLPSLNLAAGDWRRVRHNYFQVLNEQFIEHWSKPYHDYCEKNHLEWTGHYWDHDWPDCLGVPDNMAMYAWHQRPAIDCLMNQYAEQTHAQFGNARMVKELSSVANQLGMARTLCEVYGAGGWDLRFEDMKRIGDWLEVLGVNTLNQHLSYVTLRGARKRDHPQSFSYHEPWWDAYHVSADYLARVSTALSQGQQVNRILVIEPTTTAWMHQGDGSKLKEIGDSFFKLIMALENAQVEYDLGCEDVMARHGRVQSPALQIGQREYTTIVVPDHTENLNASTTKLLEDYLAQPGGGEVLCLGETPGLVDGQPSPRLAQLASKSRWKRTSAEAVPANLSTSEAANGFRIQRNAADPGILFHHRRQLDDGELLFLVNTSKEHESAGTIRSPLRGVQKWDLYTGQVERYAFIPGKEGIEAGFSLPPSGSLLLFLSQKPIQPSPVLREVATRIRPESGPEIRRLEPNVLTIDYVDVAAGDEARTNMYFYAANQIVWKQNGMARDPWDSAVQYKDELISKRFPAGSGFEATYKFTLAGAVPADLAIVIERPDLYTITCNGQAVTAKPNDWWLDKAFGRLAIARWARLGENRVTVKASPFTMFHELEPAYLLGDFRLVATEAGFVVNPPQPLSLGTNIDGTQRGWNAQGHPFYSAGVAYRERFPIAKPVGQYVVSLANWYGSVARVSVNGKAAGIIDAPPWEADITRHLKRGDNDVTVTVVGTLKNTLGPHHGNPPLGAAWPSAFQKGPESGPPPGVQYSTVGYGLFAPFELKQITPAN